MKALASAGAISLTMSFTDDLKSGQGAWVFDDNGPSTSTLVCDSNGFNITNAHPTGGTFGSITAECQMSIGTTAAGPG